jgi:lipoprotein LprA
VRQRGWYIAPATACLLTLLVVGCGSKKNNTNNVSGRTAIVATPTPTLSAQDLLTAARQTLSADSAFHFALTHENGTTPIVNGINMRTVDGDIVKPDKLSATVGGTITGGQSITVKVIGVGQNVWINLVGNKYTALPGGVGASAILDPSTGVSKAIAGAKNPHIVGEATINGVQTTEVDGTVDAGDLTALDDQAQAGKQVNGRIWIGNADHQVYRVRLEGPVNDQEPANIARQIDLSKFNETVDIQPPAS